MLSIDRKTLNRLSVLLVLTIITVVQGHPFLEKSMWFFFALLCASEATFAIYALFFFSAFFNSSGFFPNLFFTLKYFHFSFLILIAVLFIKGKLFDLIKRNIKHAKLLIPWGCLIGISVISGLVGPHPYRALMTTANLASITACAAVLICVMERKSMVADAALFFAFGACWRVCLSLVSYLKIDFLQYQEGLIHNNHIGFLTASALFMLLPFFFTKQERARRFVSWIMLFVLFSGLVLSCSRTGWVGFIGSFVFFGLVLLKLKYKDAAEHAHSLGRNKRFLLTFAVAFSAIILVVVLMNSEVLSRIGGFKRLIDPSYWSLTFQDTQNFGFLGAFRRNQFVSLGNIFQDHWLFGVGFIREVTDFHSVYLSILGATGVVGFLAFLCFCFMFYKTLLKTIYLNNDDLTYLRIGILSAFTLWLIYSLMETFIVQFNVWIIFTLGILLQAKNRVFKT